MSSPIFLNMNGATIPTPITPHVPMAFQNAINAFAMNSPVCTITSIHYRPFLAVTLSMSVWKKLNTYPRQNSNIRQAEQNNTSSLRLKLSRLRPVRLKIVSIIYTPHFLTNTFCSIATAIADSRPTTINGEMSKGFTIPPKIG